MKHVSFSQVMTYVRCPQHYLFRYILGIKRQPRKVFKSCYLGKDLLEGLDNAEALGEQCANSAGVIDIGPHKSAPIAGGNAKGRQRLNPGDFDDG